MATTANNTRIGVDVGGTFTDVIVQPPDGRAEVRKLLSTPPALRPRPSSRRSPAPQMQRASVAVVHGTTVATNAVLQRRGARDRARHDRRLPRRARAAPPAHPAHVRPLLAEARAARAAPPALRGGRARDRGRHGAAPARRGRGARARGAARAPPASRRSPSACSTPTSTPTTRSASPRSCASELPGRRRLASSEILREQREYERSATTVVNAYVRPLMGRVHRRDPRRPRRRRASHAPLQDHAVVGRRDDLGGREAAPRARARVGPGRGRDRGARHRGAARRRERDRRSTWAAPPRRRR